MARPYGGTRGHCAGRPCQGPVGYPRGAGPRTRQEVRVVREWLVLAGSVAFGLAIVVVLAVMTYAALNLFVT
jgi:hypothetical protein